MFSGLGPWENVKRPLSTRKPLNNSSIVVVLLSAFILPTMRSCSELMISLVAFDCGICPTCLLAAAWLPCLHSGTTGPYAMLEA